VLTLPRLMLFYTKAGREIELQVGEVIEGEDDQEEVSIFMKMTTETREFKVGERISFSADEFEEIGYGCWAFATDLSKKLPRPKTKEGQSK
jgi:hypothetical protein